MTLGAFAEDTAIRAALYAHNIPEDLYSAFPRLTTLVYLFFLLVFFTPFSWVTLAFEIILQASLFKQKTTGSF
jgi:hypothetical protein